MLEFIGLYTGITYLVGIPVHLLFSQREGWERLLLWTFSPVTLPGSLAVDCLELAADLLDD